MQNIENIQSTWRVLLIGGNTAPLILRTAQALAGHLRHSLLLADDFRLVIQQMTTPAGQPGIHYLQTHPTIWQKSPEALCDGFITTGNALVGPLASVVLRYADTEDIGPVILAGIDVIPALTDHPLITSHTSGGAIRSIFLIEEDETAILRDLSPRDSRGPDTTLSPKVEQTLVHAHQLYGRWLHHQADQHGLPTIPSHPRETCPARLLHTLAN